MARKLIMMMALIGVVLLAQAVPGLADTFSLSYLGDSNIPTWSEGRDGVHVGSAGSSFHANSYTDPVGLAWNIPDLSNDESQTVYTPDGFWVTVKTVYNALAQGVASGTPLFYANLGNGTVINSSDTVITLTGTYLKEEFGDYPYYDGRSFRMYTKPGDPYPALTMEGSGTSAGAQFTFIATLFETDTDHTHKGYFENFTVTYPTAAATPIPGAVWLLGTGLLGLACVGRRWRS